MHALLLCAGLGTRLRPLTDERPKPLVPVLGRPLASYAIDRLADAGVRHIVANTHHLGAMVGPTLAPHASARGVAFETVHESVLLGTGGAIRNALPRLGDTPFVVFNGDVLAAPDIARALELHERARARMTLVLREDARAEALGAIDLDANGRVVRILGEGPVPATPHRRCMFTGIYVVSPDVAPDLPENGCVVRHTMRRLLARGETVAGIVDTGVWFDLGTPATYAAANFGLLSGAIAWGGVERASTWRGANVSIGSRVRVDANVVLGDEACVEGEGTIENVIAWDGARVRAPLANAIVSTRGAIVPIPG